jgi:hypothetical protein
VPTVREDLRPVLVLPAPKRSTPGERLSVYPAEHWEKWGGEHGRFRVMRGESWLNRPGERVSFYTLDGVAELVRVWALEGLESDPLDPRIGPDLEPGTHVFAWDTEGGGLRTRTRTAPFQDANGEWRVYVFYRRRAVLLEDIKLLEVRK